MGNLLGSNQPQLARMSGVLSILSTLGFMAVMAVCIFSCRNIVGYIFSSDPLVVETVAMIAPYAALFQVRFRVGGVAGEVGRVPVTPSR